LIESADAVVVEFGIHAQQTSHANEMRRTNPPSDGLPGKWIDGFSSIRKTMKQP
jgi:hypothetical protein